MFIGPQTFAGFYFLSEPREGIGTDPQRLWLDLFPDFPLTLFFCVCVCVVSGLDVSLQCLLCFFSLTLFLTAFGSEFLCMNELFYLAWETEAQFIPLSERGKTTFSPLHGMGLCKPVSLCVNILSLLSAFCENNIVPSMK